MWGFKVYFDSKLAELKQLWNFSKVLSKNIIIKCQNNCQIIVQKSSKEGVDDYVSSSCHQASSKLLKMWSCEVSSLFWFKARWVKTALMIMIHHLASE